MRSGARVGVDVGSVRVGLASSDPGGLLATPVRTLRRGAGDLDAIAELVAETAAVEVVVGLPRSLSGAEGTAAGAARVYAGEIAARVTPVSVRLVDERLSTVDAERVLSTRGVRGPRQRSVVDQAAAVIILQSALDAERATGNPPGVAVNPSQVEE